MSFKTIALAATTALSFALPAFAQSAITVEDPYARVAGKMAKAGAAFMVIENSGDEDDRLISAASDVAKRTELHTHKENAEGHMQMLHVKEGFVIPAGGTHALARGGDHVMFMGLTQGLDHGDIVNVTLIFEKAGEVALEIPVDLERKADHGAMKHGDHAGHGN
ncbi:copper chaperone PCu(A)C [Shimia sp. R11_0]|uniref:copper chaperone PCu(A)C n=1 Tax=Shimia sp. R11_0 TaxID=2821096 RepID=UPI001ADA3E6C|nr:copper chaperone PCu(A)C [Shimia sp. R11_0]MBO9478444.1 copper chaperone PCu(A)C [Shimia sp. R11_0]